MDEGHRHRPFSYRRGTTLHRAVPDIAGGKDARNVCLQVIRITVQLPVVGRSAILHQVGAGDEVAGFVAHHADLFRPLGVRHSAQAEKEPCGIGRPLLSGLVVTQGDRAQDGVTVQRNDFGIEKDFDYQGWS